MYTLDLNDFTGSIIRLMHSLRAIFSILIAISTSADTSAEYETPKQKAVKKLVELIIDPKETENLRKDLLLKIQSSLALSNNAIFEELLQESGAGDKSHLIRAYQKIESKMNQQIAKSFCQTYCDAPVGQRDKYPNLFRTLHPCRIRILGSFLFEFA